MYIGLLRLATIPQVIVEVVKVMDIGFNIPSTPPQVIAEDMLIEADLGHNRPSNILLIYIFSDLYFQKIA